MQVGPDSGATHGGERWRAAGDLGFDEPERVLPGAVGITDRVVQVAVGADTDDLEEITDTGAADLAESLGRPPGDLRFDEPERVLPVPAGVADGVVNRPVQSRDLQISSNTGPGTGSGWRNCWKTP